MVFFLILHFHLIWDVSRPLGNFSPPLPRNGTDFSAGFSASRIIRRLFHFFRSIVMPLDTCFDDEEDENDDDEDDQPRIMYL